jgi:hypothetical protein
VIYTNFRGVVRIVAPILTFAILFVHTAFSAVPDVPASPAITEFRFDVEHNAGKISEAIVADIYGDTLIVGIIPYQQKEFNLVATFVTSSAEAVKVNGVEQQSAVTINNFTSPVSYVVSSAEGSKTYKVKLVYTGLPLVYVYTKDAAPIENKDDYVAGVVKIYSNNETPVLTSEMGIRGRGNTTWTLPKKPYRIKLGSAASILGMPSDKDWILLANYSDKTLMRNSLAYYLGSKMNFAYTPRTTHVDLVLNGVYQGNYVLGEHIKTDKDRVDIKELDEDDTDLATINGGYFLELDEYRDGTFFELTSGLPFVIKSPDDVTDAQLSFIKDYMQQTENALFSDNFANPESGYAKFINPETFIEFYWVNEVLKNIDAHDFSSIFYYKDRDEKLNMGPLWDFDVAAGNASVDTGDDPTSFYVRDAKWFKRLFQDSVFKSTAEKRWFQLRDGLLADLPNVIDSFADKLKQSQQLNFYKWNILNQSVWPSPVVLGSYKKEVDYLKEWMWTRIDWIDSQIEEPVEVVTGVGDNTFGVSMFPNPTSKELYIQIPSAILIDNAEIIDEFGRTAISSSLSPGITTKIDVSALQRGMYVVILRGKIDVPVTNKVILK